MNALIITFSAALNAVIRNGSAKLLERGSRANIWGHTSAACRRAMMPSKTVSQSEQSIIYLTTSAQLSDERQRRAAAQNVG